jgi:cytosine/adenosine deaminase-related metal-dependent hydrolase
LKDSGVGGWYCWQTSHTPSYGPGATLPLAQAFAERAAPPEPWRYEHAAKMRDTYFSDSSQVLKFGLALGAGKASLEQQRTEITKCRQLGAGKILQHYSTPIDPPPGAYRGIVDLAAAGLLGPDLHYDHANNLTPEDLRLLAKHGGSTCSTVMGEFPYAVPPSHWRARAAGVATSIGMDVPIALNNDYFETVRASFWNMYRTPEGAKAANEYESEDVLAYATTLGAQTLGHADFSGSLTVGMRADVVLLATNRFGFAPHGSLATRVVNFGSWADVDSVWIAGVAKKRGGKMLGVDMLKLRDQQIAAHERAEKIAETITFT